MATWDDVRRLALALPATSEREGRTLDWRVGEGSTTRSFVWERPLRPADLAHLGAAAPTGPVLGARVIDEAEKAALIEEDPAVFFTTPHFDGYPAILVALEAVTVARLAELVEDAWRSRAPARVAARRPVDRPGR